MPSAPTFIAEYEADWSTTTTPKTVSVTVNAGDTLVIYGGTSDQGATLGTPTGGGLTYTLQTSIAVSSYSTAYIWTATSSTSQTFTLSIAKAGSAYDWGFNVLRFSGVSGFGTAVKANASGAPSLSVTTGQANSAIVMYSADWNPVDGATRTYNTTTAGAFTEQSYYYNSGWYTIYGGYYANAGAAGAKTVGITAPTGQKYSTVAIEVKGPAGSSTSVSDAESVTSADSVARGAVTMARADAETVTASNTVAVGVSFAVAVAGAATAADTVAVAVTRAVNASGAAAAADSTSRSVTWPRAVAAAVTAADSDAWSPLAMTRAVAAGATSADAATATAGKNVAVGEVAASSDAATRGVLAGGRPVGETITAADTPTRTLTVGWAVTGATTAADAAAFGAVGHYITAAGAVTAADAVARSWSVARAYNDSVQSVIAAVKASSTSLAAAGAATVAGSAAISAIGKNLLVAEMVGVADAAVFGAAIRARQVAVTASLIVSVVRAVASPRPAGETAGAVDDVARTTKAAVRVLHTFAFFAAPKQNTTRNVTDDELVGLVDALYVRVTHPNVVIAYPHHVDVAVPTRFITASYASAVVTFASGAADQVVVTSPTSIVRRTA